MFVEWHIPPCMLFINIKITCVHILLLLFSCFFITTYRIIEPLTSRCSKFRFKPLSTDLLSSRLQIIAEGEGLKLSPGAMDEIVRASGGDMRKGITFLQSAARLRGTDPVTDHDIKEIAGVSQYRLIAASCNTWLFVSVDSRRADWWTDSNLPQGLARETGSVYQGDLLPVYFTASFSSCSTWQDLLLEGFSASQALDQLHDRMVVLSTLTDKQKSVITERMAVSAFLRFIDIIIYLLFCFVFVQLVGRRLMEGGDEYLQLMDLTTVIMYQFCHAQ